MSSLSHQKTYWEVVYKQQLDSLEWCDTYKELVKYDGCIEPNSKYVIFVYRIRKDKGYEGKEDYSKVMLRTDDPIEATQFYRSVT